MASSLPLPFQIYHTSPKSSSTPFQSRRNPNNKPKPSYRFPISACLSSSNPSSSSSWDREEVRWLREEQRWIREEHRWIREESRWKSEREFLLREISTLKLQIEALEREKSSSISDTVANLGSLLQALKDKDLKSVKNQIPESVRGPHPILLEEVEVKEMVLEETRVSENVREDEKKKKKKKTSLRKGSEGKDVLAMQEALQRLGFYSGEEDMEYSTFSSGTERAVKTWQATLGASEDGIMTAELLERLFMELEMVDISLKVGANGAAFASVIGVSEIQQTVVKENDVTEAEVSEHRVFLLGENRWEDPSRVMGRDKQIIGNNAGAATKCLACRGEGHLLCTECDGTGEPNIEEQFLDWVDEGAKCPYCEGLGYTTCDACEGKRMIPI